MFPWSIEAGNDAYSLFSPFKASTDYFDPSSAAFMVNLRVDDLDAFLAELKSKGIEVLGTQDEEYGKFAWILRSEEHTSELQSLMRISYAVFCLKKKKNTNNKILNMH